MSTLSEWEWAHGVHGKNGRLTTCSFCGRSIVWQKYAEHLDKRHPNGHPYFPKSPKKHLVDIIECGVLEVSQ